VGGGGRENLEKIGVVFRENSNLEKRGKFGEDGNFRRK
jgi:hypothetical protein